MNIKLVVFDFDGIFTDGKCYFDNNNIQKYYNIKDGMALKILKDNKIITGLISSYSSEKDVYLNENKINDEIINHLNFDYKYIGKETKINILDSWLKILNLNYDNVAYIGDDINDIEIMKKVGFSGCPSDAVEECKQCADYICKNKGGNKCVREFIDTIINKIVCQKTNNEDINIINEIKTEFNYQIGNFNIDEINKLAVIIKNIQGNIYFCGVGKSGNIAKHCCDLLKCISFPSFYFNILNSTHGDIGTLTNKDIILIFSNSGNTQELVDIIPLFKNIGIIIVGICCNEKSKFKELCNKTIVTPFNKEISGIINKIPTNSYMSHLIFSNILVSILKKNINLDRYKENHLSGNIGNDLLKVKDVLIKEYPKIILTDELTLIEVIIEITNFKIGCAFFVDNNDNLLGILTDGDIRRIFINNKDKNDIIYNDINTMYYYETELDKFLNEINRNYSYIPILIDNKIIGIISNK